MDDFVLPTTNFAFNNSMVFEATFNTNVSAGPESNYVDEKTRTDGPVSYTDSNGMIDGTKTIKFGSNFSSFNRGDANDLPLYTASLNSDFLSISEPIFKDAT